MKRKSIFIVILGLFLLQLGGPAMSAGMANWEKSPDVKVGKILKNLQVVLNECVADRDCREAIPGERLDALIDTVKNKISELKGGISPEEPRHRPTVVFDKPNRPHYTPDIPEDQYRIEETDAIFPSQQDPSARTVLPDTPPRPPQPWDGAIQQRR